ncbi:hypothetical protein [Saccharopolyspora pogona]|uniref:hypothetical protein n=1 Tax=Saccharopolyspora pogona TaxID=333966 RepID=UPI0037CCB80C
MREAYEKNPDKIAEWLDQRYPTIAAAQWPHRDRGCVAGGTGRCGNAASGGFHRLADHDRR